MNIGEFSPSEELLTTTDQKRPVSTIERTIGLDESLPIAQHEQEIRERIGSQDTSIIIGETGSGKSTMLPLILMDMLGSDAKIAITQPRRLAARSVAKRVADLYGTPLGQEVGYRVRFEDETTAGTNSTFMTEGILLGYLSQDPMLRSFDAVVVDEAHERGVNVDLLMGLLKQAQKLRQKQSIPPLKLLVTSATINKDEFANFFEVDVKQTTEIPGRLYPVEVSYEETETDQPTTRAAEVAKEILTTTDNGDILIFMPGESEIRSTIKEIERLGLQAEVLPLFGDMAPEDQDKIFAPSESGLRKIIVSTNIAETSLTVPGVTHVIDSGLAKQIDFDPHTGIESLNLVQISKANAEQRKGRAGRIEAGTCHRLYPEQVFDTLPAFGKPEIQRSSLSNVVLQMKQIGVEDVERFDFISPPDPEAIHQALAELRELGALDGFERITKLGREMARLPLEPRLSRAILEAVQNNCVNEVATMASLMSSPPAFWRAPRGDFELQRQVAEVQARFKMPESDFSTMMNIWQQYVDSGFDWGWARANYLRPNSLEFARLTKEQILRMLGKAGIDTTISSQDYLQSPELQANTIKSLLAGFSNNILIPDGFRLNGTPEYRQRASEVAHIDISRDSSIDRYVKAGSVVLTSEVRSQEINGRGGTFIGYFSGSMNEVIPGGLLAEMRPDLCETELIGSARYDETRDTVLKTEKVSLKEPEGSFHWAYELTQRQVALEGPEATMCLAQNLADANYPLAVANRDTAAKLRQMAIRSGHKFEAPDLVAWYAEQLDQAETMRQVLQKKTNLVLDFNQFCPPELLAQIEKESPETIEIGNKRYSLEYQFVELGRESEWTATLSPSLTADELARLDSTELPRLPDGCRLVMKVTAGKWTFEGSDVDELKQRVEQRVLASAFDDWNSRNSHFDQLTGMRLDQLPALATKAKPSVYTKSWDGADLVAYPAYKTLWANYSDRLRSQASIAWFRTPEEAQAAQEEFEAFVQQGLEQHRENNQKQEFEQEIASRLRRLSEVRSLLGQRHTDDSILSWTEFLNYNTWLKTAGDSNARTNSRLAALEKLEALPAILVSRREALTRRPEVIERIRDLLDDNLIDRRWFAYEGDGVAMPDFAETRAAYSRLLNILEDRTADIAQAEADIELIRRFMGSERGQLLQHFIQDTQSKNYGIWARIKIENGKVYTAADAMPLRQIEIGRSSRTLSVERQSGQHREVYLKPSWGFEDEIALPNGAYVIGRDGRFIYEVAFDDSGRVVDVISQVAGQPFNETAFMDNEEDEQPTELELAFSRARGRSRGSIDQPPDNRVLSKPIKPEKVAHREAKTDNGDRKVEPIQPPKEIDELKQYVNQRLKLARLLLAKVQESRDKGIQASQKKLQDQYGPLLQTLRLINEPASLLGQSQDYIAKVTKVYLRATGQADNGAGKQFDQMFAEYSGLNERLHQIAEGLEVKLTPESEKKLRQPLLELVANTDEHEPTDDQLTDLLLEVV